MPSSKLSSKLETDHSGSLGPPVSQRIQNTLHKETIPISNSCDENSLPQGRTINAWGNQGPGGERSSSASRTNREPIHLNNISGRKRKWKRTVQTSDQSESTEQIRGMYTFQDGKSPGSKGSSSAWGLHDEARFEGRLLHSASPL